MAEERAINRTKDAGEDDDKNALEWTVFAVSLLLVLSILAYLVYQVSTEKPSSPDLVLEHFHDPSDNAPQRYRVVVYNRGGETAEEVLVELVLEKGGEQLERVELSMPFVPKASKREGWLIFREEPGKADTLVARVVSYKKP